MKAYNLNLATGYVPGWGAWEVAREVICNAMDADTEGMAMTEQGEDVLKVTTTTVPDLSQLFIIGDGTKRPGGETIGQFGEGIKMAALAATRMRQPTHEGLVLRLPTQTVRFEFREVMEVYTLHALVEDEDNGEGFTASIRLPGVGPSYRGKILPGLEHGPFDVAQPDGMRVFIRGVFITQIPGLALWDWNLNLTTNRDRAMVSEWDTKYAIGAWLAQHMTVDQAKHMMQHDDHIEPQSLEYHGSGQHAKDTLVAAFKELHGDNAVLALGNESDEIARKKGNALVTIEHPELRNVMAAAGVQTSRTATKRIYDLEAVDIEPYRAQVKWLRQLDDLVKAPPVKVQVFANRADELRGHADFNDRVLWLSEGMFVPGGELELVRTYLHELGHFMTGATDGSVGFEVGLDRIAGGLGMYVLDQMGGRP